MELKTGAHFEERANKEVFLVLGEKEILLKGIAEQVITMLYYSEKNADDLERMIPGALKELENLSDWVE